MSIQNSHEKNLCRLTYIALTVGGLMQFNLATSLIGTIALLIGVGIAYYQPSRVQGSPLESHYQWLIRTFWIGSGVYLPALLTGVFALMYPHLDFMAMMDAVSTGSIADPMQLLSLLIRQVPTWIVTLSFVLGGAFVLWWLYRCGFGWQRLGQEKPIENVMRWL